MLVTSPMGGKGPSLVVRAHAWQAGSRFNPQLKGFQVDGSVKDHGLGHGSTAANLS